jgi:hypothetical protein
VAPPAEKKQAAATTDLAETPGLPRATVGTAYTWSPWCTGLVGHHARNVLAHVTRDTSVGVSGPHDFAVRNEKKERRILRTRLD